MMRYIITTALFLILPFLCSCTEDDGPDAPGLPPSSPVNTETGLTVTFTGKHFRLADGVDFTDAPVISWSDTVWQNDRIYNQLLLTATDSDLNQLALTASPLESRDGLIPAENVTIYTVGPVSGDAAPSVDAQPTPRPSAVVYDALLPVLPSKITGGEKIPVWLTIDIPDGIPTGSYSGEINISVADKTVATCNIDLLVTDKHLPEPSEWEFHLDLWQFPFRITQILNDNGATIKPLSDKHFEILKPFYSLLADAGQKTITTYIKDGAFNRGNTMIGWTLSSSGKWTFDYTDFDRYVEFMDELGISRQISCFSLAGWNNVVGYTDEADGNSYKYKSTPIGSQEFNDVYSAFLTDFRNHLKQKGWFERAVLFMDENTNDEMRSIVNFIRSMGDDWKIGLSGRYIDADIEREFYNYATIIGTAPTSTAISVPVFYTSCSQLHPNNYLSPLTSPAEMTWMAWHALAKGFKGYQRWAFDNWSRPDIFDARDGANTAGDFHMIYRSNNDASVTPVSSIRMHMLRDGIQDYEKARIIGHQKLRSAIRAFGSSDAPDAASSIKAAQSEIKKLSVK